MNKNYDYWSNRSTSSNRGESDDYYERKSKELVFYLQSEKKGAIVDFGCGDGKLTAKLSNKLDRKFVAVDYSSKLLEQAMQFNRSSNITFVESSANEFKDTYKAESWISCGAVGQYSTENELCSFVLKFANDPDVLELMLFDCVDTLKWSLFAFKVMERYDQDTSVGPVKMILGKALALGAILFRVRGKFAQLRVGMGYGIPLSFWKAQAKKHGLKLEMVSSAYFEYRYHVILKKTSNE